MFNWRRILVTGMVAGMIAFTGCSSNLPETNQGNRNGQRVVDAVNRRTDTYNTTRSSAARRATRPTRSARNHSRGLRTNTTTRHNTRYNTSRSAVDGVTRNVVPNRSVHNRGRVGNTFGYQPMNRAHNPEEFGAYDLGMHTGNPAVSNPAIVDNRVVRSSPTPRTHNRSTTTRKATATTRKAAPVAPKASTPTRSTTAPRTTAPKTVTPARSAAAPRTTAPKTTTPTRSTAPRTTTRKAATPKHTATTQRSKVVAPRTAAATTTKPALVRNTTPARSFRNGARAGVARSTQPTHSNRASRRANVSRRHEAIGLNNATMNHNNLVATPLAHNANHVNQPRPTTHPRTNTVRNDHAVVHGNMAVANHIGFTAHNEITPDRINPAVFTSASDDGDYAFFRRNKVETTETPAPPPESPAPTQAPSRRITPNLQPEPTITPMPVTPSSMYNAVSETDDHSDIHDVSEDAAYDNHTNDENTTDYGNQLKPIPKTNPGKSTPTRRVGHRVMK